MGCGFLGLSQRERCLIVNNITGWNTELSNSRDVGIRPLEELPWWQDVIPVCLLKTLEVFWHIFFVKTTIVQVSKSMIFCHNAFCSKLVLGKSYFYDIMIIRTLHVAHVISKRSKLIGTNYVYTNSPDSLSNIMVLILWVNRIWYFIFANYSTMKEMKARGISLLSKYK